MKTISIGFIGAGKVGKGLGVYFCSRGHLVAGYYSRNTQSAQEAAELSKSCVYTDINELVNACGMIILTTPDEQIIPVWQQLKNCDIKSKIICHTSGSLSSSVFEGACGHGAYVYSIHPMYAFSDKSGKSQGLENAYFTIEGDPAHLEDLKNFISSLGNKVLTIDTDRKVLYHIANVTASNLVLALLRIADNCMQQSGIGGGEAMQALMPLILGNISSISEKGVVNSLTGPIERNDLSTIQKHLGALPEQYGIIYSELSVILTQLAEQKHSDRDYTLILDQLHEYRKDLKKGVLN